MKTKNKILALVEIAVVLCSVFLVAIPAIAAEQNQEMQEVSANTLSTASKDDYVLDIFGNANEDDTIDMRDLTYVKLIFFGKKSETELADAKYDGKINPLDFIQIKLIIVGKEKEITIVDYTDRIVTVKKPVERIVLGVPMAADVTRMLGEQDKTVGVDKWTKKREVYYPELSKLPSVGGYPPDAEMILSLNPDLVITWEYDITSFHLDEQLPGIPVVAFRLTVPTGITEEEVMKLGYILGKKDRAEEFFDDFYDKYIDLIKARTEGLSEEKKPKVYWEIWTTYKTYGANSYAQQAIDIAGGRNIFADVEKSYFDVEAEEVAWRNPDIIIKTTQGYGGAGNFGYESDDPSDFQALRESIMNRIGLAGVSAVENERIYVLYGPLINGMAQPIAVAYCAKWFHPDLFEDLDPQGIHQEFIDKFCPDLDFDVSEHGVFVYPPLK